MEVVAVNYAKLVVNWPGMNRFVHCVFLISQLLTFYVLILCYYEIILVVVNIIMSWFHKKT
jgi:hypothetical protein